MSLKQLQDVIFPLMEDLNTPRSLTVSILLRNEEWDQLLSLKADPVLYNSSSAYYADAIASDILRKCAGLISGDQAKQAAVDSFYAAERQCCETNARLDRFLHNGPLGKLDFPIVEFLNDAKREMAKLLGPVPRDLCFRFGPGATYKDRGAKTTVLDKMSHSPQITSSALCLLPLWERTAWYRAVVRDVYQSAPEVVRGNRFTTVPKDSLKDRGIAIEPSFNVSAQLSLGSALKDRLSKFGIDLLNGQDHHRRMAMVASRRGEFATIDLSSASDTVCYKLVRILLDQANEWFTALDCLRSPLTEVNGRWVLLEKFSSMGNGYTFELETAVFLILAIVYGRSKGVELTPGVDLFVYGDDIIIPVGIASGFTDCLRYFGFTPNDRKTFISGRFKESCGADYFDGHWVRPLYIKEVPDAPEKWISLANGLRTTGCHFTGIPDDLGPFTRAWFRCISHIPSAIRRCRGPERLGDLVIHDRASAWSSKWRGQIRYFRVYRPVAKRIPLHRWRRFPNVQLAAALYGVPSAGVTPRGGVSGYKIGRVPLTVLRN